VCGQIEDLFVGADLLTNLALVDTPGTNAVIKRYVCVFVLASAYVRTYMDVATAIMVIIAIRLPCATSWAWQPEGAHTCDLPS
jgi:hypothetical protein